MVAVVVVMVIMRNLFLLEFTHFLCGEVEEKITSYYSEKKSIKKIKANITSSQQIIVFKRIFSPIMASFAAPDRWKPPITA